MVVENELVRTVLIPEIVKLLCKYYAITPQEAMRGFYESSTQRALECEETGLYGQSPLYIASLFIQEKDKDIDISRFA